MTAKQSKDDADDDDDDDENVQPETQRGAPALTETLVATWIEKLRDEPSVTVLHKLIVSVQQVFDCVVCANETKIL
jgi:hypothetical protein